MLLDRNQPHVFSDSMEHVIGLWGHLISRVPLLTRQQGLLR